MTFIRLIIANWLYFWRGNLAVLLGVAVGCAVLTGALLVGDSLQGSLRAQSARRLGWVTHSLVGAKFFREELAQQVADESGGRVVPALMLQATVLAGKTSSGNVQARGVTVIGLPDKDSNAIRNRGTGAEGAKGVAVRSSFGVEPGISSALARTLGVKAGDAITIRLQKAGVLPREMALGKKEIETTDWTIDVACVFGSDNLGDAFNLRPELDAPHNLFVPLADLQKQLALEGRVNALLASGDTVSLQTALEKGLQLEDWGLVLRTPTSRADDLIRRYGKRPFIGRGKGAKSAFPAMIADELPASKLGKLDPAEVRAYYERRHPYLTLESRSLYLSDPLVSAALEAAKPVNLDAAPTLVYLCKLQSGGETRAGVVAALDPSRVGPLGPFLPPGVTTLKDDALIAAGWTPKGQTLTLRFKPPESHGPAPDVTAEFTVAGAIPLTGVAADPALTPEFPGITDKDDIGDWQLPFDDPAWQQQVVRKEYGSDYWDRYRATPRAYISLAAGRKWWASRFGDVTSIRLAKVGKGGEGSEALDDAANRYRAALRARLKPADGGFTFDPIKAQSEISSQGGTPFGLLFLGFSFFLIAAALLLVGLLYRLELERRARQAGVLFAEGFTRRQAQGLFLGEGGLVALGGVLVGTLLAVAYSRLLLQLLAMLWPGGVLASFLAPYATPASLGYGAVAAFAVSVLTIAWGVRLLGRVSPRLLLSGRTEDDLATANNGVPWWLYGVIGLCVIGGATLLLIGPTLKGHEAQAGTFFGSGALFLTAGLCGAYAWMRGSRGGESSSLTRLGLRNAARAPLRSLLTVGLLASAAFLIVAVESFRRHVKPGDGDRSGPDGGFALIAESDLPLVRDLNGEPGREELLDKLERRLTDAKAKPSDIRAERERSRELLKQTTIIALRVRAGDDASCLNLYKPRTPRVLGVPSALIARGGFAFDATARHVENPWTLLNDPEEPFACFGESNTVMWMLQKALGGDVAVPDERGAERTLRISGLLHDSVFQSSLLISEANFLRLYPGHEGYHFFLIAPPSGEEEAVKKLLESTLVDRGLVVSRSADRLAAFLAVENTYLTTFQALGGLGLLLGSLGLAVVLLRAVWERRAELALLRALGYTRAAVACLILVENGFLLLLGLAIGATAAILSISPQLRSGSGEIPWTNLATLFAGVFATALIACTAATWSALRAPIVPALRRE